MKLLSGNWRKLCPTFAKRAITRPKLEMRPMVVGSRGCASILILTVDQALLDDYELGSQPMSIKKILAVAHYKERQEVGILNSQLYSLCYNS
jgi:hypothetical protein